MAIQYCEQCEEEIAEGSPVCAKCRHPVKAAGHKHMWEPSQVGKRRAVNRVQFHNRKKG